MEKYLSESALSQADYILSRFPVPPYVPAPIPQYLLVGECPCDTCRFFNACKESGHECRAFQSFVQSGSWMESDTAVKLR